MLDHSALVPSGDKPEKEKAAAHEIAERILDLEASWYVTTRYLRPLASVVIPHWDKLVKSGEIRRYPRLIQGLKRTIHGLIKQTRSKAHWCKPRPLSRDPSVKLRLHVMNRNAEDKLEPGYRRLLDRLGLAGEDREVLALALLATRSLGVEEVLVVTADHGLLNAIEALAGQYGINSMKPSMFASFL